MRIIKPIATCIDELLQRHTIATPDQINAVSARPVIPTNWASFSKNNDDSSVDTIIRRLDRLESNNKYYRRSNNKNPRNSTRKPQCSHCTFVNNKIGSSLSTDHRSDQCGRKRLSVSVVESFTDDQDSASAVSDDTSEEGEIMKVNTPDNSQCSLQNNCHGKSQGQCTATQFYPSSCAANNCCIVTTQYYGMGRSKIPSLSDIEIKTTPLSPVQHSDKLNCNTDTGQGNYYTEKENLHSLT